MNCEQIFRKVNSAFQKSFNKFFFMKNTSKSYLRSSLKTRISNILKNDRTDESIFTFKPNSNEKKKHTDFSSQS